MSIKINFITLAVPDLVRSEQFYTSVFDFFISERSETLCLFASEDKFSLALRENGDFSNQVDYTDRKAPVSS